MIQTYDARGNGTGDVACTITGDHENRITDYTALVCGDGGENMGYIVRRFTPREAERLMGFPDDWTDIGEYVGTDGKKRRSSDTVRYRALGNSIAVPCFAFVLGRAREFLGDDPTLGSLFDGIGGFPLAGQMHGIRPVWASEIEEFPIAVTKLRFPEEKK